MRKVNVFKDVKSMAVLEKMGKKIESLYVIDGSSKGRKITVSFWSENPNDVFDLSDYQEYEPTVQFLYSHALGVICSGRNALMKPETVFIDEATGQAAIKFRLDEKLSHMDNALMLRARYFSVFAWKEDRTVGRYDVCLSEGGSAVWYDEIRYQSKRFRRHDKKVQAQAAQTQEG